MGRTGKRRTEHFPIKGATRCLSPQCVRMGVENPATEEIVCEVAMGNAQPELKALADYITDDSDQDGILNACRVFGWIKE